MRRSETQMHALSIGCIVIAWGASLQLADVITASARSRKGTPTSDGFTILLSGLFRHARAHPGSEVKE
jgi:hypothetical protein